MLNLKPCPFCEEHELLCMMVEGAVEAPEHHVYCAGCTARGPTLTTQRQAADAWNGRREA